MAFDVVGRSQSYVWNVSTLVWDKMEQPFISGSVTVSGSVSVTNAAGASAVNIQDGGNSITVDGSVTVTQATGTNLHTVLDSGTLSTITNVVHVDDNGGSLTVDGTVTANIGTTNGLALDATLTGGTQKSKLVDTGGTNVASVSAAGALKVDASSVAVPVTDNGGSLTVDGSVAISTVGQTTMSASVPVTMASDQSVMLVLAL